MKTINNQRGVGLVEVLVALLVLAIGVLGFVALQYRAVEATTESTYRIQAINIARDLAERVRVNRGETATYVAQMTDATKQTASSKDCFSNNCTTAELAAFDVTQVVTRAHAMGMSMRVIGCPLNNDGRNCVYVAWDDTAPDDGAEDNVGNCTTTTTNSTAYDPTSTCLIMELY